GARTRPQPGSGDRSRRWPLARVVSTRGMIPVGIKRRRFAERTDAVDRAGIARPEVIPAGPATNPGVRPQEHMRTLSEPIDRKEPAWPLVQEWIGDASVPVEVLPADAAAGDAALYATQVTTRSPMGAIAHEAAGIFIDNGWLRVLGAGKHPRF